MPRRKSPNECRLVPPAELLAFVHDYTTDTGWPPSVRDVAEAFKCSTSTAQGAIRQAMDDGDLATPPVPGMARGLKVSETGMKHVRERIAEL